MIYFQVDESNEKQIMRVEEEEKYRIINFHGFTEQVCETETEEHIIYYHGIIDMEDGSYSKDIENREPIVVNGVKYELDSNLEVVIPKLGSLEEMRTKKLLEVGNTCQEMISQGVEFDFRGEPTRFSYNATDQRNASDLKMNMLLSAMELAGDVNVSNGIPWHPNGGDCLFLSAEEWTALTAAWDSMKLYHTTYCNQLNQYIRGIKDMEELAAAHYGMALPEEYQNKMDTILVGVQSRRV